MGMNSSDLDRRVQLRRKTLVDNGFEMVPHWGDHGGPVFAARRDISDAEKFAHGQVQATLDTRFTVRSSEFSRSWTPADRLTSEGLNYDILGIKQVGPRHAWLEVSCRARVD